MRFIYDPNYHFFLLQIIFNFLIGGLIVAGIIQKLFSYRASNNLHPLVFLLIGVGLSPYLIALTLNYLLWLVPNQSDGFYFVFVLLVFVLLTWVGRKEIKTLLISIKGLFFGLPKAIIGIAFMGLIVFLIGWSYYLTAKSLTEHDTLEYAVQGKVFYETKDISYESHNFDPESGFYYVGLHGYTFPLLASWERIVNSIFGIESDLFFRSINSMYGILILLFTTLLSYRLAGSHLAFFILLALPFTYGFFETIFKYHIDLYRIFFLNSSLLGMVLLLRNPSVPLVLILGFLLGAQANSHSLGALLYIIELAVIFLFLPKGFKFKYSLALVFISLFFGSMHYILDLIWGTGWIFQEIKFY